MESEDVDVADLTLETFTTAKIVEAQTSFIAKQPFRADTIVAPIKESMHFSCHRV